MSVAVANPGEIPADLAPGKYCCRLDESSTLARLRVRFVTPPRVHVPGDCLVQVVKHAHRLEEIVTTDLAGDATMGDAMREMQS